jgi:hypothetical protein
VKPEWKFVNRLPIQDRTVEVLRLTAKAMEQQIKIEQKKLARLKYGTSASARGPKKD